MPSPDPMPRPLDHLPLCGASSKPALTSRDLVLDYAGLEHAVGALAAGLRAQALPKGARVATWLPKTIEACLMPLAAARAGLVHVPINPLLKRAQVEHILVDSGAALLVTAPARAALLDASLCPIWPEAEARAAWMGGETLPPSSAAPDDLAAILYTSGSTGRPKGVMLSHANLWLGAVSVAHYLGLGADDHTLGVLPLSFDYGQNQLLSSWAAGSHVVPFDYLLPRDVMRAVEKHRITTLAGVPPLWIQLLETEWSEAATASLMRLTNSGGALTRDLVAQLRDRFPRAALYPMYGLTEAFRSTYLDPALVEAHPTSIGRAIPFAEILVVRADGSIADDDEPGELVHAGPLVAQGYWRDPERSAERFRVPPPAAQSGGMAVWSGDTVRRDREGLHHFVARDDEMIKCSGNRISPTEIEEAAQASGAVAEAVALGVADPRLGQAIVLVARARGEGADEKLRTHLKSELPAFMHPRTIVWRDSLPRNPNGKLDRAALKLEYAA